MASKPISVAKTAAAKASAKKVTAKKAAVKKVAAKKATVKKAMAKKTVAKKATAKKATAKKSVVKKTSDKAAAKAVKRSNTPQGFRFKNEYVSPISVGGFRLRQGELTRILTKSQVDVMKGNPTTKVQIEQQWLKIVKA